jgi:hypothetical protein
MHWQRLDRDKTLATIKSVRSLTDAGLFSPVTSEVQKAVLSFYNGVELYKLTNFSSLPSFTFEYLGDGMHFYYLVLERTLCCRLCGVFSLPCRQR